MQMLKSSGSQTANQIEPQRAVPAMLQSVYENLTQLEQNLETLGARLHPVLETQPDAVKGECCKSDAQTVPHAEQLEGVAGRIRYLNARTLDVLIRLHV